MIIVAQHFCPNVSYLFLPPFSYVKAAQFVDIICINHYYAWYHDPGRLEVIQPQTLYDLSQWHRTFNKSVILSGSSFVSITFANCPNSFRLLIAQ